MQGLEQIVDRYRNSEIMRPDVPESYKPCIFQLGIPVPFPAPTRLSSMTVDMIGLRSNPPASVRTGRCSNVGRFDRSASGSVQRTTLMFRNMPSEYNRTILLSLLDAEGFAGKYDFVYSPIDFTTGGSFGYSFINMISHQDAEHFRRHFCGFTNWRVHSRKVAEVAWSEPNQGLAVHIERYRNSSVMHESVEDEYKPALFASGVRVPFPPPTQVISTPGGRGNQGRQGR